MATMFKKLMLTAAVLSASLLPVASQAATSFHFGFYESPPVYVAPVAAVRPVFIPARPVYYQPAPVYYAPAATYVGYRVVRPRPFCPTPVSYWHGGWGGYRSWH